MAQKLYSTAKEKEKAFLVSVSVKKDFNPEESLVELALLVEAANFDVVGSMFQNTNEPSVQFLIGTGKLDELKSEVEKLKPNIVVFDNELSGMRLRNLEEYLNCKVIDRSMLILDIFANRAVSGEGKLQVKLAQLKYSMPRLMGLVPSNNKYGGGIGMRGPGESKLELDRRKIEGEVQKVEAKLKELEKQKDVSRKNRMESKVKNVAIVGYTNSGKSTLLNTLTKTNVLSKDMLFATLDTTSRSLFLGEGKQIVITDTVGFVSRLPHELIQAFKSTLKETIDADLLLVVVDGSSKRAGKELEIVNNVLDELGAGQKPKIFVVNKMDKGILENNFESNLNDVVRISAKNNVNLDKLKEKIIEKLF